MKFNKYWIIVSVITLANIFIFSTFSKKLETFVADGMIEKDKELIDSLNKKNTLGENIDNKNIDIKNKYSEEE